MKDPRLFGEISRTEIGDKAVNLFKSGYSPDFIVKRISYIYKNFADFDRKCISDICGTAILRYLKNEERGEQGS